MGFLEGGNQMKYVDDLKKMDEIICELQDICERYDQDYFEIAKDPLPYNACLMLIVQLAEGCMRMKEENTAFYFTCSSQVDNVIKLRNRAIHGYSEIHVKMFIDVLKDDIPVLKKQIEKETM